MRKKDHHLGAIAESLSIQACFSSTPESKEPSPTSTMSFFAPASPPATSLGRYRQLAPKAGVHVSPLCLGAMSIGDKWDKIGMGSMDKESSFKLLDAFFEAGGNFIDTANA